MDYKIKISLIVISLLISINSAAAQTPLSPTERQTAISRHLIFESDDPDSLIIYKGYVVSFDTTHKTPNWTIHDLTFTQIRTDTLPRASRRSRFLQDRLNLNANQQASHNDYTNSGFDRGHFVPAGDFFWDKPQKDDTFFVTNISPQTPDFNQIVWQNLEIKTRDLILDNRVNATVITGAIYASKRVKNRGLSRKKISIPSHLFKVVYTKIGNTDHLYCFLVPHMFAYPDKSLTCYQVSLDQIEGLVGEDFFEQLPDPIEIVLESQVMDASSWVN